MEKHYGWVVVAAGAVITCLAMGAMFGAAAMALAFPPAKKDADEAPGQLQPA